MARNSQDSSRDAAADQHNDWMWTLEDTIEERVNDALRHWVEGLENSLTRAGPKESE